MATYLVNPYNKHAISMARKMEASEGSPYIECSKGELNALYNGDIVTLPNKTKINEGISKCLIV